MLNKEEKSLFSWKLFPILSYFKTFSLNSIIYLSALHIYFPWNKILWRILCTPVSRHQSMANPLRYFHMWVRLRFLESIHFQYQYQFSFPCFSFCAKSIIAHSFAQNVIRDQNYHLKWHLKLTTQNLSSLFSLFFLLDSWILFFTSSNTHFIFSFVLVFLFFFFSFLFFQLALFLVLLFITTFVHSV